MLNSVRTGAGTVLSYSQLPMLPLDRTRNSFALLLVLKTPWYTRTGARPGYCTQFSITCSVDNVVHAWSADGETWTYTGPALQLPCGQNMPSIPFSDGNSAPIACERPQLLLENGVPTHIIMGGAPEGLGVPNPVDASLDVNGHCEAYGWPCGATVVVPLRSAAAGAEASAGAGAFEPRSCTRAPEGGPEGEPEGGGDSDNGDGN